MPGHRDPQGKFLEGNKEAEKPKVCPYCKKGIRVRVCVSLAEINDNTPLQNGLNDEQEGND